MIRTLLGLSLSTVFLVVGCSGGGAGGGSDTGSGSAGSSGGGSSKGGSDSKSGGGSADEDAITETYNAYIKALQDGNGAKVCANHSDAGVSHLTDLAEEAGVEVGLCDEMIEGLIESQGGTEAMPTEAEITDISIGDDKKSATIVATETLGGEAQESSYELIKDEFDEWLIDKEL